MRMSPIDFKYSDIMSLVGGTVLGSLSRCGHAGGNMSVGVGLVHSTSLVVSSVTLLASLAHGRHELGLSAPVLATMPPGHNGLLIPGNCPS